MDKVCLSGGTFQNFTLLAQAVRLLRQGGFQVFLHSLVPPNDGGLSLGQAVIASKFSGKDLIPMCLAIPGRISSLHDNLGVPMAKVDFGGITRDACLSYLPEAQIGDYVLVHVGFAISKVDEEEAARTYQYLAEMDQLTELDDGAGESARRVQS